MLIESANIFPTFDVFRTEDRIYEDKNILRTQKHESCVIECLRESGKSHFANRKNFRRGHKKNVFLINVFKVNRYI